MTNERVPKFEIVYEKWVEESFVRRLRTGAIVTGEEIPPETSTTLPNIAESFRSFVIAHYKWFENGFKTGKFEYDAGLPFGPVMEIIRYKVQKDIEVFHGVAYQYLKPAPILQPTDDISLTPMKDLNNVIQKASWLARASNRNWIGNNKQFLGYYSESLKARVTPYTLHGIISVPYYSTTNPHRHMLLAAGHEMGHHVYWNGCYTDAQNSNVPIHLYLKNKLLSNPQFENHKWVGAWLEEIFADVYGCLAFGASTAYSLMYILNNSYSNIEFCEDPGDRPVPVIRPSVQKAVLAYFGDVHAGKVEQIWNCMLGQRGLSVQGDVVLQKHNRESKGEDHFGTDVQKASDIEATLMLLVQEILKCLGIQPGDDLTQHWKQITLDMDTFCQSGDPSAVNNRKAVEDALRGVVNDLASNKMQAITVKPGNVLWQDWAKQLLVHSLDDTTKGQLDIDDILVVRDQPHTGAKVPRKVWQTVLFAGGWIDGPGDPTWCQDPGC